MKIAGIPLGAIGLAAVTSFAALHARAAGEPGADARWEITAGYIWVYPRSTSGPLRVTEVGGVPVRLEQPGTGVSISNSQTLAFTIAYAIDQHWLAQLVLGWPVDQSLRGEGQLRNWGTLGKGQQMSPALLLKYRFGDPGDRLQPFLAGGLNYTAFRRSRVTNETFSASTYGPLAQTRSSATPNFGYVAEVGLDWRVDRHWFVNGTLAYTPIRSTLKVQADGTPQGRVRTAVDVKLHSLAVGLNLGYRF